jgi:two-component system phosphate regulon sensor histidine kinase PhoR
MPSPDSWVVLTVQIPFLAIPFIIVVIIGAIGGGVLLYRRRQSRNHPDPSELERLRSNLAETEEQKKQWVADQEAYRHFLYNISHEVSNPLQSIQTNLDNMAECTPDETGRWQQYHNIITTEIRRVKDLTENLRTLSKLETTGSQVRREPVNIKGVIESVIMAQAEFAEDKGIRLLYNGPNRPARVFGNRDHLRQVLMNLVDNSIKYSRDGGGEVIIAVKDEQDKLSVRVIDNGIGIPEEDLPYIFDTAYRATDTLSIKRAGTGLGLAIAKRIVEQHGGEIQVRSQVGGGTTVSFDLPLYIPS